MLFKRLTAYLLGILFIAQTFAMSFVMAHTNYSQHTNTMCANMMKMKENKNLQKYTKSKMFCCIIHKKLSSSNIQSKLQNKKNVWKYIWKNTLHSYNTLHNTPIVPNKKVYLPKRHIIIPPPFLYTKNKHIIVNRA